MLTGKQEKFAQNMADGMTAADAYRNAYNADASNDNTLYRRAHELLKTPKVTARINELKDLLTKKFIWTREMSVKALVAAYKEGNPGVKVAAVKELNVMHGFNVPEVSAGKSFSKITFEFLD